MTQEKSDTLQTCRLRAKSRQWINGPSRSVVLERLDQERDDLHSHVREQALGGSKIGCPWSVQSRERSDPAEPFDRSAGRPAERATPRRFSPSPVWGGQLMLTRVPLSRRDARCARRVGWPARQTFHAVIFARRAGRCFNTSLRSANIRRLTPRKKSMPGEIFQHLLPVCTEVFAIFWLGRENRKGLLG